MLRFKYHFWGLLFLSVLTIAATQQIVDPVDWIFSVEQENDKANLILKAEVDEPWHLYSQDLEDGGPIPTSFHFNPSDKYELIGKTKEGESVKYYDPNFKMDLAYFEGDAVFEQRIIIKSKEDFQISGELEYMVCNDKECLPPEFVEFTFNIEGSGSGDSGNNELEDKQSGAHQVEMIPEEGVAQIIDSNTEPVEELMDDFSQVKDPVKWEITSENTGGNNYQIHYKATIDEGWYIYSQHLDPDKIGPIPTYFELEPQDWFTSEKEVKEDKPLMKYDPNFDMDLQFFKKEANFTQQVVVTGDPGTIKGFYEFMVCNKKECLPPEIVDFEIDLRTGLEVLAVPSTGNIAGFQNHKYELEGVDVNEPYSNCGETLESDEEQNLLVNFLLGMLGGLVALITPCVFPMIPLTVSFFTKGSEDKRKGKSRAITYGFFIFAIYTVLAVPFHIWNLDPEILNRISTGFTLNIIFFAIFVFFAGSFFGYYELTLPSGLANKADSASNKSGIIGIFFMAITLAIVSFSCTGPILGSLLAGVLKGGPWPLTSALAGFGIALGLPFALFAMFPQWLNKLPSSGGWLNVVKVVLGFVELGLAVKFLSNADLVYQLGWVKRETFFLIWFLLSMGCALYLFGIYRFPHDSPKAKISSVRNVFALAFLLFAVYLFPGMLKTPWWSHGMMAGFPPYEYYSWYDKESKCPLELDCTKDYYEAVELAEVKDKPIFIDFTGHACVNCRRMEENVWPEKEVYDLLSEKFQVVSLYVDDKRALPEEEQHEVEITYSDGTKKTKKIRTIGNKWSTLEILSFDNSTQPLYAILSPDGELMNAPVGYTPDVSEYVDWMKCGIQAYEDYKLENGLVESN